MEHILTHNTSATDVDDNSSSELDNLEEPQPPQSPETSQVERGKTTRIWVNKRRKIGLVKTNKTSQKLQQTPS